MRRRLSHPSTLPALALAAACTLALAGCAGAPTAGGGTTDQSAAATAATFPVTIDNCGVEVTLEAPPTSIVTLNQGATEQALGLGLADRMAGTAYLDDAVASRFAADYARVPVLAEEYPSVEQFLAAGPDLAISSYGSAFGDKGVGTREELAGRGIATYVDPLTCPDESGLQQPTFEAIWSSLGELAQLTGTPAEAADVVAEQKGLLARVEADAVGEGLTVLWYDSGEDTPFVGAGGGGPALIMDAVGADNVFGDLEGGWADGSWETVLEADPDVIVLADAGWSSAEDKRSYLEKDPVLQELTAVREGRFVSVPFSETTPGIRLVDGADHVAEQLAEVRVGDGSAQTGRDGR